MTAAQARTAAAPRTTVVAACQGHRCRALLGDGMDALRAAAGCSHHGVLLSTDCLGPCSHGPVVTVGSGRHDGGTLQVDPMAVLGPVAPVQVAALGERLSQAPDAPLSTALDAVRIWPAQP